MKAFSTRAVFVSGIESPLKASNTMGEDCAAVGKYCALNVGFIVSA